MLSRVSSCQAMYRSVLGREPNEQAFLRIMGVGVAHGADQNGSSPKTPVKAVNAP